MMPMASMVCMAISMAICFLLPLGLAIFFRRQGGRWRDFFLGAAVFFLFVLVLEQGVHALVLGSLLGQTISGNLILYALYGGVMAGLFEEVGRLAAFRFLRPAPGQTARALMYGAGHGGMEAVMVVGLTYISNLLVSSWINAGTLEQNVGALDEATLQTVAQMVAAPATTYLWGGVERIIAIGIHLALSVLVYLAYCRGRQGVTLFVGAILLHAAVDACTILASAFLPVAGIELVALACALGLGLVAWKVYQQEAKNWGGIAQKS